MPRVFVSRRVPGRVRDELERLFELDVHDSEFPPAREELLRRVAGVDGLVMVPADRVDEELFEAAGRALRVVANYGVGIDNVDLGAAKRRDVVVTNTPDVLTRPTAELAIALVLALLRRVAEGDRLLRSRRPWPWAPTFMLGEGLEGKTLGIVGYGRIGREVARLAEAVGMEVISTAPLPLEDLLGRADVVTLHVPLTGDTRHLIDDDALARMRPAAYVVNTARGAVVDERALIRALREGRIAGAALDVFEREPDVEAGLLDLDNVVLTPHLGSATRAARDAMGMLCVEALRDVLVDGQRPRYTV